MPLPKILTTVTDNASNMVRAFNLYGMNFSEEEIDYEMKNLENLLETVYLPPQQRCAAHTFNLVATADFKKIIDNSNLKDVHEKAFEKCAKLWIASRRPKTSEIISKIISKRLIYPTQTRWNSIYDSLERLMIFEEKLNILLERTHTSRKEPIMKLSSFEINYLKEYLVLFEPLARGIDGLQGEKTNFYGDLLPHLFSVKWTFEGMIREKKLTIAEELVEPLLNSVIQRFKSFYDFDESNRSVRMAIIASVSHPKYKLYWFKHIQWLKPKALNLFKGEVEQFESPESVPATSTKKASFLVLEDDDDLTSVDTEISRYLSDSTKEIQMLHAYPTIKKVFTKNNTPVCSSAPVERLFSFAGIVNSARRGRLTPSNFEQLVMLKANSSYEKQ